MYSVPAKNLEGKVKHKPHHHLFYAEATEASRQMYDSDGLKKLMTFDAYIRTYSGS